MAAIISTELLHYISPVLIFIFIWAILYAVLQKSGLLGKNQPINAAIATMASLLFIFVPLAKDLVKEVIPWLVIFVLIIVVVLMILMFMGYKEKNIVEYMTASGFGYVVVTIVVVLFLVVLSKVVGPTLLQYPSPTEVGILSDLKRVLFNPKVLGSFLILVIAAYLMKAIAMPIKKAK